MPGPIQSVERAVAVLRLLAGAGQGLGIVDIANALGLAKTTAHGIVRTLVGVGLVVQDEDGDYRAAPDLSDLGRPRIDANDLRARAVNWADSLASRTGESVLLATLSEGAPWSCTTCSAPTTAPSSCAPARRCRRTRARSARCCSPRHPCAPTAGGSSP